MKTSAKRVLFWTPRVLCILFALFLTIFALDVFDGSKGLWQTMAAFLIHLIPTYIVLAVLAVAWRWEWVGGALFTVLGVVYLVTAWGRFHGSAYAVISGPLFLIGALFLVGWFKRRELRAAG